MNRCFSGDVPCIVMCFCSMVAGYLMSYLWILQHSDRGLKQRFLDTFFGVVKSIPIVRKTLDKEVTTVKAELMETIHHQDKYRIFHKRIPFVGFEAEDLIKKTSEYTQMETIKYYHGKVSGAVFNEKDQSEEMKVFRKVFDEFAWSNPLWPKLYPGVRKMEAEVVRMCCDLLHGDEKTCGTMSTGGSISILLGCLAHRNRALARGVLFPEMIVPTSAHAAFFKAAEVFRMRVVKVSVDADYRVNVSEMERKISSRTCMLVGSAPNFPFGTIDDIPAIGQLGVKYGIPVHVDACLGGFILPFLEDAPAFDFAVPGVSSVSADTHKYGLAPKGSSVILYKSDEYRKYQYFADVDWQGGIYASATLEGSRSGLNIALCWAALLFNGMNTYTNNARLIAETTRRIRDGIAEIPELRLQGSSDTCIVSWTSDIINIHRVHDTLGELGWQLSALQFPNGIHIMVTLNHTKLGVVENLIRDIRDAVDFVKNSGKTKDSGTAALYGMTQRIPDRSIVKEFTTAYLDACYSLPDDEDDEKHKTCIE